MKKLSLNQILSLHQKMIKTTGGSSGIRDIDLLQSAIQNAFATFDGHELYPDIKDKIVTICFSIINNHPFIDGNKRMGIYVLLILLQYNNINLTYTEDDLVDLGMGIAEGRLNRKDIIEWLIKRVK